MALIPGARLGPYEITVAIGAGGMGEVYRATDSNLKRSVAIKVLPASVAGDVDRLARFQREAEVLAALSHPNIAAIYGLEKTPELTALVMELVDGRDLSEIMGRLALEDALPIAKQIAAALEAAHEQGIIHRDLKPANIKVRADGTVKVLDFGLAKAVQGDGSGLRQQDPSLSVANSPTMTNHATAMGMILGTAAYMAPEQARGKAVDKRADIWAFGVVLYEMLTGERAFKGDDVSETLASVLKDTPDLHALPSSVPPRLRALIARCLDRDVKTRLRDIGEARILLSNPLESAVPLSTRATVSFSRWPGATAAAAVMAAAIVVTGTVAGWWGAARPIAPSVVHVDVDFGGGRTLQNAIAISPDGQRVAFVVMDEKGKAQLMTRRLDEATSTSLHEVTATSSSPFFSPDSRWIGWVSDGEVLKIAVEGGPVRRIASGVATSPFPVVWGADEILITTFSGTVRVSIKDGTSSATQFPFASFLPDGRTWLISGTTTSRAMGVMTPGTTTPRPVPGLKGQWARYLPAGVLVYIDDSAVLEAQPFDISRLEARGAPVPLMDDAEWFDISETGTVIATRLDVEDPGRTIDWVDEAGRTETIVGEPGSYVNPRLSPDGTHLAMVEADRGKREIVIRDLRSGLTRSLIGAGVPAGAPSGTHLVWTPDGRQILYEGRGGVWSMREDGGGSPRRLLETAGWIDSIAPDAHSLAIGILGSDTKRDIWRVPLSGPTDALQAGTPERLVAGPADEINAAYSPDGKWLAYSSDQSGLYLVYVLDVHNPQSRWQVSSTTSAYQPQWSPGGQELFFAALPTPQSPDLTLLAASYSVVGGAFVPGGVRMFGGAVKLPPAGATPIFDVASGGHRVVAVLSAGRPVEVSSRRLFSLILNALDAVDRQPKASAVTPGG